MFIACFIACFSADAAPVFNVASGSILTIESSELPPGLSPFTAKPKVYYIVNKNGKPSKKSISVLTNEYPCGSVSCKMGTTAAAGKFELYLVPSISGKPGSPVLVTDDFNVLPPSIASVSPNPGASGMMISVAGTYFGTQKPKIIIQCTDAITGRTYKKNCMIKTPLVYPDEKGNPGKSCMDVNTGESQVIIFVPSSLMPGEWILSLQNKTASVLSSLNIAVPEISSMAPDYGSSGDEIIVSGNYFGQNKPKIWLEYTDPASGIVKKMNCTVKTPLEYPDPQGHGGKSCMDLATGQSRLRFFVPSGLPGVPSIFHLDNVTGASVSSFTPTFYITGKISRDIIQNVELSLYKDNIKIQSVESALDGSYKFNDLVNGAYTVIPSEPGYFFYPASYSIEIKNANSTGNNFTSTMLGNYLVMDVSGGPSAPNYPSVIFGSDDVPSDIYSNETYKTDKIVFRKIATNGGAVFSMGSPADEMGRMSNEVHHQVTITEDYYLCVFEITQAQYLNVTGSSPSYYPGPMMPVEQVSWNDIRGGDWPGEPLGEGQPSANSFVGILSAKSGFQSDLPTEAQWEMACRSGTGTALNTGFNLTNVQSCPDADAAAWYSANSAIAKHRDSGGRMPNFKGFFDMHGNVWELCLDFYISSLGTEAQTNPVGPETGSTRTLRGGGWSSNAGSIRSARRSGIGPNDFFDYCGFRAILKAYNLSGTVSGTASNLVKIDLAGDYATSVTTNSAGAYVFYGLLNGNYTVTPSLAGHTFEPLSSAVEILSANVPNVNFTSSNSKFTISGKITGDVQVGALLTLTGTQSGSATSLADGSYGIAGLSSGNYTVTPSLAGYTFSPAFQNVSIYGTNVQGIDFTAAKQ